MAFGKAPDAKPGVERSGLVRITPWRLRKMRRQAAMWRDKEHIASLKRNVQLLQTKLGEWERWCFAEWFHTQCGQPQQQQWLQEQPPTHSCLSYTKWDHLSCYSSSSSSSSPEVSFDEQYEEQYDLGSDPDWADNEDEDNEFASGGEDEDYQEQYDLGPDFGWMANEGDGGELASGEEKSEERNSRNAKRGTG